MIGNPARWRWGARAKVSIVIPTLQRSDLLTPLVDHFCGNALVKEVIIINNAAEPVQLRHEKMRVLNMPENIFVNPAWNLGASVASGDIIALVNDDIVVDANLLQRAVQILNCRRVGIVGIDFTRTIERDGVEVECGPRRTRRVLKRPNGFGIFMALHRQDYTPIPPDGAKIFFGDDWLFLSQRHVNFALSGTGISTRMSTTSGSSEFVGLDVPDIKWWNEVGEPTLLGTRGWHTWGTRTGRFRPLLEPIMRLFATRPGSEVSMAGPLASPDAGPGSMGVRNGARVKTRSPEDS